MRRLLPLKLLILGLLAACVTVNVYFPAAAAEQAADRIIDTVTSQPGGTARGPQNEGLGGGTRNEVGDSRPRPREEEPNKTPPQSRLMPGHDPSLLLAAAGALLNLMIPAAQAQGTPDLDISDPQIRAVTASMQQRFVDLKKYFDSGVIGLTADGQVTVRDPSPVPLAERAVVTRLVTEDNRDRATLYAELARANKHPEWEPDIRRTFARRWVERGAQPGWYYQDTGGRWLRK
jgi:uncharacterized protein YdbL (DUF1318 family)